MSLTYEVINNPDIVEEYIDDYLYNRLKHDGTKGIQDFIAGGHHLGFYNNGNLVGIITFADHGGYFMAHV
jgi:hypothetical protein